MGFTGVIQGWGIIVGGDLWVFSWVDSRSFGNIFGKLDVELLAL